MSEVIGLVFIISFKGIQVDGGVGKMEDYLILAQSSEEEQPSEEEDEVEEIIKELEKKKQQGKENEENEEELLEEEQMYLPYNFAEREEKVEMLNLTGYYRARIFFYSNLPWDYEDKDLKYSNHNFVQSRLRLEPTVNLSPSLRIKGTADILDDVIWGTRITGSTGIGERTCPTYSNGENVTSCGDHPSRIIVVKRFWAEIDSIMALPVGFKIGRQPVHYGLGIFFNDGDGFKNLWGDAYFESTRDRISINLSLSDSFKGEAGFDFLLSGLADKENFVSPFLLPKFSTDFIEISAYLGAMYTTSRGTEMYFILPYVGASPMYNLKFEIEGNVITGNTDMLPVFGDFARYRVFAWNLAGRIKLETGLVRLMLDGGFASGDDNPRDQKITSVPMNPDYNVGFILFEDILARHYFFIARNVEERDKEGKGRGKYYLSKGGVLGSYYIMPTVGLFPFESAGTYLSILLAFSNQNMLLDPTSGKGLYGREEKKGFEGAEIDWGLKVGTDNFNFGIQLGYLILGEALRAALPSAKNTFKAQLRFTYMF